jgi:hypothetical protein
MDFYVRNLVQQSVDLLSKIQASLWPQAVSFLQNVYAITYRNANYTINLVFYILPLALQLMGELWLPEQSASIPLYSSFCSDDEASNGRMK